MSESGDILQNKNILVEFTGIAENCEMKNETLLGKSVSVKCPNMNETFETKLTVYQIKAFWQNIPIFRKMFKCKWLFIRIKKLFSLKV